MATHTLPFSSLELRFTLHADASREFIEIFRGLKTKMESHDHGKIISLWRHELTERKIGNVVDRQILYRAEGGIGGDCNQTNRQLRLSETRYLLCGDQKSNDDMNDIKLLAIDSEDRSSIWSITDVQVFGRALKTVILQQLYKHVGFVGDNCLNMFVIVSE